MRRLVPFLIAAMMAFPSSSFLLLLIGPVITSGGGGGISCTSSSANHCHNYGGGGALTGVVAATSTYATPSRTMSSSTAAAVMMMAGSSSLSVSSGLMGASATEVNFNTPHTGSDSAEPANRIDNNHGGELSLGDNQQLKVEVLGGSPHCSFSMVEFTNTHQTKDCIIHSTYIAPTVVFPMQEHDPKPHNLQSASPIFNVEFPPERALHVKPKSSVVVPVSVFPRWKKPYEDVPHRSHHPPESSSSAVANHDAINGILDGGATSLRVNGTASSLHDDAILLDTADIIQKEPRFQYNKIDETHLSKHQIHETIVANTSWGFFQMKVPTVCSPPSKEYEYGLPNNLIFLDGGGGWYARRNTTPTAELAHLFGDNTIMPAKDPSDPFVYNIYMNNPTEKEVRIVEVFTTKPDLVGLEMRCNKTVDASEYYPLIGSRILPRRNNMYVGTVRLFPENFRSDMLSSMQELGFLVIRTNIGLFATALDFIPTSTQDYVLKVSENFTTLSGTHLIRDHIVNEAMKNVTKLAGVKKSSIGDDDVSSSPLSVVKVYRLLEQGPEARTTFSTATVQQNSQLDSSEEEEESWPDDAPVLKFFPAEIDFGIITSGSRIMGTPIQIANPTNAPLRVMRISVVMKTVVEKGVNITELANEPHRLEIGFSYPDFPPTWGISSEITNSTTDREDLVFAYEILIPERNAVLNALNIWCKFTATPGATILPRSYEGSIIFRVTQEREGDYQNWEERFLRFDKDSEGVNYATKIDFKGSILPGAFGIPPESLMFPASLPGMSRDTEIKSVIITRDLEVTNNFGVPISIKAMQLHEPTTDFCRKRFSMPTSFEKGKGWKTAAEGEKWKGLTIKYHLHDDESLGYFPQQCVLTFETDKVGNQSLPLVIYTGSLMAEIERPDSSRTFPTCFQNGDMNGMNCANQWSTQTPEGGVLRNALRDMRKGRDSWPRPCGQMKSLENYFCSLTSPSRDCTIQKPIIMPFGPVSAGSVVKRSFYLTNLNPLPVEVSAATAVMGNMSVSIGHVPIYMPDMLNEAKGNDDLKYFLQQSSFAQDVFSKLQHKADISLSERAKGGELESWFYRQQVIQAASNVTFLGNTSEVQGMRCSGGFVLSTDGSFEESIISKQATNGKISIPAGGVARFEVAVRVPERSVLKNDVTPFVSTGLMLETNYGQNFPIVITYRALSGQLELKPSINVGNEFYCGSSYEDASKTCSFPCPSRSSLECPNEMKCWADTACGTDKDDEDEPYDMSPAHNTSELLVPGEPLAVEVPATIRDNGNRVLPFRNGVSLSIGSTFSHDIFLSEVKSCNKWFSVLIPVYNRTGTDRNESSSLLSIKGRNENKSSEQSSSFGTVYSVMMCSHPSNDKSFYACALEWLERRDHIQPPGCGLPEVPSDAKSVKHKAITAIRDVVTFLSVRYASTMTSSDSDGSGECIKAARVKMFDAARSAWDEIVSLGLNVVTGDISAKTLYDSPESGSEISSIGKIQDNGEVSHDQNTLLTIPMPSVLLRSTLEIPKLFAGGSEEEPGSLKFDTVHVGETTSLNVPVRNPTGMPVRVRLTAAEFSVGNDEDDMNNNVFVQSSPSEYHPWWTGGSYWMSDNVGNLISATHNVTIKSGAGAFVSLLNPALHTMSSFVLGCGSRCAISNEVDSTVEAKLYSAVGAASGNDSELFGRPHDKASVEQGKKSTPHQVLGLSDPPPFSLGRTSMTEIVLPPYGTGALGPVTFRPSRRSDFSGSLYIENSLTGIEEVKLRGSGGWENLAFVDDDSTTGEGGDVEYRFGRSALVFSGSSSTERDSVVKSFVLLNQGDFPVKIDSVSMASSEVEHFTHKRKHPSFSFRPDGLFSFWSDWKMTSKCSSRGFSLIGCNDEPSSSVWNSVKHLIGASEKPSEEQQKQFEDSFELLPNENKTFYVEHRPDCSFMTSYASVIFGVDSKRNRHQAFRSENVELIVGFDMNGYQLSRCIPYSAPDASFLTKTVSFTLPSTLRDVLSLGLTKITDANGNPKIPNRPIRISYLGAVLILVLLLMAIDLMYWSDFPPEGADTCSSWNATCRCLARADPASADLVAIGKEQTKHVLLSRYRKEGVLPSHCVSSDGNFRRDKGVNAGVHNTFSDSIFKQHKMAQKAKINSDRESVLPGGLCWRTAFSRRIGRHDIPRTSSMMSRTRELYAKHQKLQKAKAETAPPPLVTEKETTESLNGKSAIVKPKKVDFVPAPQDRAPQGTMGDSADWVKASSSANGKKTKPKSDQLEKPSAAIQSKSKGKSSDTAAVSSPLRKNSTSTNQAKAAVESSKPKVLGKGDAREATVKKSSETKSKQKLQNEVKSTKKDRTTAKQEVAKEEVPTKKIKRKSIDKSDTKVTKRETKQPNDSSGGKVKQVKQSKKANDSIKVADQSKLKEGKQKTKAAKTKQSAGAAKTKPNKATGEDFPPLSSTASAAANMRPPPGLLAPPGFNDKPGLSNSFPQTLSPQPSTAMSSPTRSLSSPSAGASLPESGSFQLPASVPAPPFNDGFSLGGMPAAPASPTTNNEDIMSFLDMRHSNSTPPLMQQSQSKEDVKDLLGTSNDFNIGNFLDGILSDEPPIANEAPTPALPEANPFQAVAAVPLDPWNSSSSANATPADDPLSTLLGSTSTQGSGNDPSVIAGIPLNSGASSLFGNTMQSGNASGEPAYASLVSDEGEKDNDTFNEPDSFYNQLLGED